MSEGMQGQIWRGAGFAKSSYSDPDSCVFVARPATGPIAVKDGKSPQDEAVIVDRAPWTTFVWWVAR